MIKKLAYLRGIPPYKFQGIHIYANSNTKSQCGGGGGGGDTSCTTLKSMPLWCFLFCNNIFHQRCCFRLACKMNGKDNMLKFGVYVTFGLEILLQMHMSKITWYYCFLHFYLRDLLLIFCLHYKLIIFIPNKTCDSCILWYRGKIIPLTGSAGGTSE